MTISSPHDPPEAARHTATGLLATVRLARELVDTGRPVDLAGLDDTVGRLCARILDLPPHHGRLLMPVLQSLATAMDALHLALEQAA